MSKFHSVKTIYRDRDSLVAALGDLGYTTVEVHDVAQRLVDYHGNQTRYLLASGDVANVIVRREHISSSANDIGFLKHPDGTFEAIISEYESRRHGAEWVKSLTKSYTEKAGLKTARALGFKVVRKETTGNKIQYRLVR